MSESQTEDKPATEQIPSAKNVVVKEKFEERYKSILGERYDEFMCYSTSYVRKSIRVNTLKKGVKEVLEGLSKNWTLTKIPWCDTGFWLDHKGEGDDKRYDIGNTLEHILGQIYVQDAASMIPPVVLDPQPGETVLDMCAAPGSKTSQMAAMMKNTGTLIANDLQGSRLKALGINLQRMGVINTICTQMAGSRFSRGTIKFDRVLVDAPCSGTGTIRKAFINLKMWSPGLVRKFSSTQKPLIQAGFDLLKPGGTMVYSTCTMEPEENEMIINWLLEKNPDARVEEIKLDIKRSPCMLEYDGKKLNPEVAKTLRIWPQDNDTEGFYVAKIVKKKD
ncbi:RsmB/NOP family class I SAM-dependent RNA methyltransferase [Candidatus Woesearchaeota archaeon]|nr:RsmB/NOP family class I SAM-dependent RNA methyltransferase [Candidatus Woesearchaeota archaeon]